MYGSYSMRRGGYLVPKDGSNASRSVYPPLQPVNSFQTTSRSTSTLPCPFLVRCRHPLPRRPLPSKRFIWLNAVATKNQPRRSHLRYDELSLFPTLPPFLYPTITLQYFTPLVSIRIENFEIPDIVSSPTLRSIATRYTGFTLFFYLYTIVSSNS